MTYDVQRWEHTLVNASGSGYRYTQSNTGRWVLAADAEAHENAAVQQAIRDCIEAVDDLANVTANFYLQNHIVRLYRHDEAIAALRALLGES